MSKKNKFDLTHLVHQGVLKDGETLFFVSDPTKTCTISKQPNHEFKVVVGGKEVTTIHAFAQKCLGMDPPDHAAKWFRTAANKTLFDIWHASQESDAA
jgi:hypothetical protein